MKENISYLPTEKIYGNPNQPRKLFKQTELEELADSIKLHGQLQAGRVRPDGNGKYMIVMGERRFRACQLAGIQTYKAIIDEQLDNDTLAEQAIIENLIRSNVTPIEEARAFNERLQATGYDVKELAKRLGIKRPSFIQKRIDLLNLNPEYQTALEQGGLTIGQANELAKLNGSGQRQLVKMIETGKVKSHKDVVNAACAILEAQQQVSMFAPVQVTDKDKKTVARIERKITSVKQLLGQSIKDNDLIIFNQVNPHRAKQVAEEIKMIRHELGMIQEGLNRIRVANDVRNAI